MGCVKCCCENCCCFNCRRRNAARVALNSWIKSPKHRANLLKDFSKGAVAVVKKGPLYSFTQSFATPDEGRILNTLRLNLILNCLLLNFLICLFKVKRL